MQFVPFDYSSSAPSNLRVWLPRVLLSLLGIISNYSSCLQVDRGTTYTLLSALHSFSMFQEESHCRCCSMLVTLTVRSYCPVQKRAAFFGPVQGMLCLSYSKDPMRWKHTGVSALQESHRRLPSLNWDSSTGLVSSVPRHCLFWM